MKHFQSMLLVALVIVLPCIFSAGCGKVGVQSLKQLGKKAAATPGAKTVANGAAGGAGAAAGKQAYEGAFGNDE